MPLPVPIPPSPDASEALLAAFAERDIQWCPGQLVRGLDPARKVLRLADGSEMPYDLFLGVPMHRGPRWSRSPACASTAGFRSTRCTLETSFPGVYAVGDVTSVGTPEGRRLRRGTGPVVADGDHRRTGRARAAGRVRRTRQCYLEFGHDQVARVDVTFVTGQAPTGTFEAASSDLAHQKSEFGATRVQRWFGREWAPF